MFRINRLTDYAVVVLGEMSRSPGVRTVPQIAGDTGVPLPTVAKLMKTLAHAGLVASHRGAGGGYTLSRPPVGITVADIIEAIEGPIAITTCVEETEGQCGIETLCPMHGHWSRINQAIRGSLERISLAEIATVTLFPPVLMPTGLAEPTTRG
ncbi:MAG: SUF system Fe-S cluster assembly regulator [Alphaproteobacteria bacterium]|nr:SUF system Fe-S cluster assembly regulator [Alphaproteobacteria bacterium]